MPTPSSKQQRNRTSGNSSTLTEAAERAMALRMEAASTTQSSCSSGIKVDSSTNTLASTDRPSVIKSESAGVAKEDRTTLPSHSSGFFSPPVFPGQMTSPPNHATPYHAAAHQFQQTYVDGSNPSGMAGSASVEMTHTFGSSQKCLPGFADFRRQLGSYTTSSDGGYPGPLYPTPMPPATHYASAGHMPEPPIFSASYPSSAMMPSPSNFMSMVGKPMQGGFDSNPPMVPYSANKMPVFPGMPTHQGHDDAGPRGMQTPGEPQQYDPMLQFQPLSSWKVWVLVVKACQCLACGIIVEAFVDIYSSLGFICSTAFSCIHNNCFICSIFVIFFWHSLLQQSFLIFSAIC